MYGSNSIASNWSGSFRRRLYIRSANSSGSRSAASLPCANFRILPYESYPNKASVSRASNLSMSFRTHPWHQSANSFSRSHNSDPSGNFRGWS